MSEIAERIARLDSLATWSAGESRSTAPGNPQADLLAAIGLAKQRAPMQVEMVLSVCWQTDAYRGPIITHWIKEVTGLVPYAAVAANAAFDDFVYGTGSERAIAKKAGIARSTWKRKAADMFWECRRYADGLYTDGLDRISIKLKRG